MKMKKLTALALAGVLCLGMSTTAFAADSVETADAIKELPANSVTATDKDGEKVDVNQSPVNKGDYYGTFDKWDSIKPENVDESVRTTLTNRNADIDYILRNDKSLTPDEIEELNAEKEALNQLMDSTKQFVVGAIVDVERKDGAAVTEDDPLDVTIKLNGAWEGIKAGEKVNLLHAITNEFGNIVGWEVFENVEVVDDGSGNLVVKQRFESLSPVAILRFPGSADNNGGNNGGNNGTNPDDGNLTPTPDANGNITADQLADLIVKRLQQNSSTKVVNLTSSSKASPKTGE